MNTKNNKKRRESVERIKKAFLQLLETKELPRITVSELCQLAQINRSTFYANYQDVYDLADGICADLQREVDAIMATQDGMIIEASFLDLLRHMNEHRSLYLSYFKLNRMTERNSAVLPASQLKAWTYDDFVAYHVEFFRHGFNAIIQMWLEGGCVESPEQIQAILLSEYRGRFFDVTH